MYLEKQNKQQILLNEFSFIHNNILTQFKSDQP